MRGPYRVSDNAPPAPIDELGWRRRVAHGARWAEMLLVANVALLVATGLISPWVTPFVAVAWLVVGLGLVLSAWMLTRPAPGHPVEWGAWLLRGSVVAYVAVVGPLQSGMGSHLVSLIVGELVLCAGMNHLARLFRAIQEDRYARWTRLSMVPMVLVVAAIHSTTLGRTTPVSLLLSAYCLLWGTRLLSRLQNALRVDHGAWYLDTGMEPPGEWVALLLHGNKQAEVLCMDETLGWFASKGEATQWLEDNGYVPAERALAERLVDSVPPDILPMARRSKRLRVEQSAPRVRVDADTSDETAGHAHTGAADELDENAMADGLDTAEPMHTLTVEKPDEH
jgi:hypothetical protein